MYFRLSELQAAESKLRESLESGEILTVGSPMTTVAMRCIAKDALQNVLDQACAERDLTEVQGHVQLQFEDNTVSIDVCWSCL